MTPTEGIFNLWFVLVGGMLLLLALAGTVLQRLPLSAAMLYLAAGYGIGPAGLGLIRIDPVDSSLLLERVTEVVVIVSLFSAGLKLRTPLSDRRWHVPVRLASVSMMVTVGLVAAAGMFGLGLPLGAAVLLGAVLAPTDPVLASDVQVEDPHDQDRLRFGLTGEAGLNDGTAFPFVMLGLGLLELHEIGEWGWRWLLVDVLWAISGGLAIGAVLGTLTGQLIVYLRREHRETVGTDDFLGLGLIALSYGAALFAQTYGFLAVFAAGLALRRVERRASDDSEIEQLTDSGIEEPPAPAAAGADEEVKLATDPEHAPAFMARAVLGFSEQLERIGTVGVVLLVGGMLSLRELPPGALWFVPLLFLGIRPLSVLIGVPGTGTDRVRKALMSWFGVRGIGSVYYLMYAVEHGLPEPLAARLTALVLTTVAVSVVAHGISVTPMMHAYGRWTRDATTPGRP